MIRIRNFCRESATDKDAWKSIGLQWLEGYTHHAGPLPKLLEDGDFYTLDYPVEHLLAPGGEIWFAELLMDGKPEIVGTIGLMPHDDDWEVIKLGVRPHAQGRGIGRLLVKSLLEHARVKGIGRLVLDTSSHLITAVELYQSFGFKRLENPRGHFVTADIAMELDLTASLNESPETRRQFSPGPQGPSEDP